MSETPSLLQGSVIDRITGRGAPGFRVEVRMGEERLAEARTDETGQYEVALDMVDPRLKAVHLSFRVFRGDTQVGVAPPRLVLRRRTGFEPVDIELDLDLPAPQPTPPPVEVVAAAPAPPAPAPAPPPAPAALRGRISTDDGRPVANAPVRALRRQLRAESPLAEGTTDATGAFELPLDASMAEAGLDLDVVVVVLDEHGGERARSRLFYGVRLGQRLDVLVSDATVARLPERRAVTAAIAPLLGDHDLAELGPADLAWLAKKTGVEATPLARAALARGLAGKSGVDEAVLYALARQDLATGLDALLAHPRPVLRRAVESALADHLVEPEVAGRTDEALDALGNLMIERELSARPGEPASLAAVLAEAGLSRERRAGVLRHAHNQGFAALAAEFWSGLDRERILPDAAAYFDARLTVQLAHLTLGYLPLLRALRAARAAGRWSEPRHLARFESADWEALIGQEVDGAPVGVPHVITGASEADRRGRYARLLVRILEEAFPAAAMAARINKDPSAAGSPERFHSGPRQVAQFLDAHPDIDLRRTSVRHVLAAGDAKTPSAIDPEPLILDLERLQRCLAMAPPGDRARVTLVLLREGLDSCRAIRRMGRRGFRRRLGEALGGEQLADAVFDRADALAGGTLALYGAHRSRSAAAGLLATGRTPPVAPPGSLPQWEALFGPGDAADGRPFRSVTSPAAYLVDLLGGLDQRPARAAGRTALDVLLERRPDLQHLAFTAENTHTSLPQIDLLNEVLEASVAADARRGSSDLGAARSTGWPQTTAAAEELAAHPEHLDPRAYDVLREAVFPLSLPFDLWLTEARVYLGHLGVPRSELMRLLRTEKTAALSLAAERLQLDPASIDRITRSVTDDPDALARRWGLADSNLARLQAVPELLRRTASTFAELEVLLDLRYVDPRTHLEIVFDDDPAPGTKRAASSRDPARAHVPRLQWPELDRLQRFLRLKRAGALRDWTFRELDRAIEVLGAGVLSDELVVRLADVDGLRQATGLAVTDLLAWYGPLDTRPDGAGPSQYDRVFQDHSTTTPAAALALTDAHEPSARGAAMRAHAQSVCAALGLARDDLERLLDGPVEDRLSLANLSHVYRIAALARAVRLSVRDLVQLMALWGDWPVADGSGGHPEPRRALDFLDDLMLIRERGHSVAELVSVLTGGEPFSDEERARLARDVKHVRNAVKEAAKKAEQAGRAGVPSEHVAVERLAGRIDLPVPVADAILRRALRAPAGAAGSALGHWLDPELLRGSSDADLAPWERTLARFERAAAVVRQAGLDAAEVAWLAERGAALGLLQLDALPLAGDDPASFAAWRALARLVRLRDRLPGDAPGFVELLDRVAPAAASEGATAEEHQEALLQGLSRRLDWPVSELEALAGHLGWEDLSPSERLDGLHSLVDAGLAIRRLGVPVDQAVAFSGDRVDRTTAVRARLAARARCADAEAWRQVARPLRDGLRERQRAALVAYLEARRAEIDDADDLSGHLLVDVRTSPGPLTTRLQHAIATVQRFIQRGLLGLEPDLPEDGEGAREWQERPWMQSHLQWADGRMAFLQPEGCIDPARLGRQASPFFEAFDGELSEGALTDERAEGAFRRYLAQLEAVSDLSVVAVCVEAPEAGPERLHVFGRSRHAPAAYWYRQRVEGRLWTPWERIALDIEGEHLLPVVQEGRLTLFWAVFADAPNTEAQGGGEWRVRLAWSRREDRHWSPKGLSDAAVATHLHDPPSAFVLRTQPGSPLVIDLAREVHDLDFDEIVGRFVFDAARQELTAVTVEVPRGRALAFKERFGYGARRRGQAVALPHRRQPLWAPVALEGGSRPAQMDVVLGRSDGPVRLVYPLQTPAPFLMQAPFFYRDAARTFLVEPEGHLPLRVPRVGEPLVGLLSPAKLAALSPPGSDDGTAPAASGTPAPGRSFEVSALSTVGLEHAALATPPAALQGPAAGAPAGGGRSIGSMTGAPAGTADPSLVLGALTLPELAEGLLTARPGMVPDRRFRFSTFYHPQVRTFLRRLEAGGASGLLRPDGDGAPARQPGAAPTGEAGLDFRTGYDPTARVRQPFPADELDFSAGGAYAQYNWELLFHAPFLVATRLSRQGRYADAQRWLHTLFDPTDRSGEPAPLRFWKLPPFRAVYRQLDGQPGPLRELQLILSGTADPDAEAVRRRVRDRIAAWRAQPLDPHRVARDRVSAYMQAVVLRYVDNLLAWGDALLADDTVEAREEAAQRYDLAAGLLGPGAQRIPRRDAAGAPTFALARGRLDAQSEALRPFENAASLLDPEATWRAPAPDALPDLLVPFFGLPAHERLDGLREAVADRLFKLRNGLGLAGTG